jgi:putative DNA methylase
LGLARERIYKDAVTAGMPNDDISLDAGGTGARAYAEAVTVYLACALSRLASYNNSICHWNIIGGSVAQIFSRQAIPISWDFIEVNNLEKMSGNWLGGIEWVAEVVETLNSNRPGTVVQLDAAKQHLSQSRFVSTDPPYYDNIGYADLADFFYVWLRQSLRSVFPVLFATLATPKADELVAAAYRHQSDSEAEAFFLKGMTRAMHNLALQAHPGAPITIYYAFKQSETGGDGTNSTGWETFLEAVLRSGMAISGTWPIRTEKTGRMRSTGSNALASSIILVCRPRTNDAGTVSRRQFVRMLNEALPLALDAMTRESEGVHSPVAPVDLSQSIIGPGMAIFSRYDAVLEADGSPMTVKAALQIINRFLAEDDFDADTQFCLHWFEQYGWETGNFGEADVLARSKGTSVDGVKQAGVLHAAGGNVRLLKWAEYPRDWDPKSDQRLPIWEVLHQLIRVFNTDGETGAAAVFAAVQSKAEAARQLAYRLYTLCERKNWAEDARAYNEVVTSWSGIESAAAKEPTATQPMLFDN